MNAATLIPLKTKALAAVFSGLTGFTLTEAFTNQYFLATVVAVLSSIGGALMAGIPRIMREKTAGRRADANIAAELWARSDAFSRSQVEFFKSRLAAREWVLVLERKSKHKAVSECQRLVFHINLLESMMKAAGVVPPDFATKTYEDLLGDADSEIEAQAAQALSDQARTNEAAIKRDEKVIDA